jgi:hypothetical protein
MGNRKKATMKGLRPTHTLVDEIQFFSGRPNGYICSTCDKGYLCIDIDEGTTPMFSPCFATEGCKGQAVSMGYPEGEPPAYLGEPIIHWVKPDKDAVLPEGIRQHVERGGLIPKATASAPEWVKAAA